ncbi:hypothetical protein TNIN_379381 [Trichonephila inaurata madagascariensis]|uniref:Uncharacterized protein n=1 Tax=Trichonephila inaurata madagascariensis TaxID=2747483 RepID=A0A8X6YRC3_9ARAC|nr:hypothetical protein TNIN_379381 [Trichonephila inaurata madagascariensis]
MIRILVGRFEKLGSVANHPGRGVHQNIHTEDSVETVRLSVANDPSVSTRRGSSQMGISRTTLRTILKLDLKIHPYKFQTVQTLLPQYHLLREIFDESLTSKNSDFPWPPRSPNFNCARQRLQDS